MDETPPASLERDLEEDLTARGRTITLRTRGRQSGLPRRVTIGFVAQPDGSLLVAASQPETHWARNLAADPRCTVELAGRRLDCVASPLHGDEANAAISALILRYGTPAERLGAGPAFRLVPSVPHA